jgi:hypothetical protein
MASADVVDAEFLAQDLLVLARQAHGVGVSTQLGGKGSGLAVCLETRSPLRKYPLSPV